jgi:LPS O-antigen subunit length determinant protein (WzzB/FepE family)
MSEPIESKFFAKCLRRLAEDPLASHKDDVTAILAAADHIDSLQSRLAAALKQIEARVGEQSINNLTSQINQMEAWLIEANDRNRVAKRRIAKLREALQYCAKHGSPRAIAALEEDSTL